MPGIGDKTVDAQQHDRQASKPANAVDVEQALCHPKAHLKACLLLLTATRPAHGYELCESLRAFGYKKDGPSAIYRALRWLEEAGLLQADWEMGVGPARRVYHLTADGAPMALTCAASLRARNAELETRLAGLVSDPSNEGTGRHFQVLIEATLNVTADDIESAKRTVESALAGSRPLTPGVWTTGEAWIYEAVEDSTGSETGSK